MSAGLLDALRTSTTSFRVGMTARGNDALVGFIDLLQAELEAAGSEELAGRVLPLLSEIIGAQQRGDYLRVADLLEHELGPRL